MTYPYPPVSPCNLSVFLLTIDFNNIGLVVRTFTDNTNRAVSEIKSIARKHDVKMASAGSVLFQFDLRGIIDVTSEVAMKERLDEAALFDIALSCGVDDAELIPSNTSA